MIVLMVLFVLTGCGNNTQLDYVHNFKVERFSTYSNNKCGATLVQTKTTDTALVQYYNIDVPCDCGLVVDKEYIIKFEEVRDDKKR